MERGGNVKLVWRYRTHMERAGVVDVNGYGTWCIASFILRENPAPLGCIALLMLHLFATCCCISCLPAVMLCRAELAGYPIKRPQSQAQELANITSQQEIATAKRKFYCLPISVDRNTRQHLTGASYPRDAIRSCPKRAVVHSGFFRAD